ncbi:MAG: hypothetical protein ACLFM1_07735 [Bacteroidales bacterium]
MNKTIYVLSVVVFVFISCNNNDTSNNNEKKVEQIVVKNNNVISPVLLNELNQLIDYRDSLKKKSSIKTDIYVVHFYKSEEGCFVLIGPSIYYRSEEIKGYTVVKDKLIVIYNTESGCSKGLVDTNKLEKGKPKDFPDENSDIAIHTNYDPWGKKFKIHSKDSLELVYSGYL